MHSLQGLKELLAESDDPLVSCTRSSLLRDSNSVAPSYLLRFACASVSIRADDMLHLYGILDEAMDRVVLLDLEKDLRKDDRQTFTPSDISLN